MPHFDIRTELLPLTLAQPFTIARGTKQKVENVVVQLSADGIIGYGEAAPNKRYNEDANAVIGYIEQLPVSFLDSIQTPDQLVEKIDEIVLKPEIRSAKAALEAAWLDWWSKKQDKPLWEVWNSSSNKTPPTSYTIGLDTIDVMQQKAEAAADYPILKVKLGTDRDRAIINALREVTNRTIRVDANEGWTSLEEAKRQIKFLEKKNTEIVEQPMPAAMKKEMQQLKQWSPLPLFADESFKGDENLVEIGQAFDGINIKLAKIGSLIKAKRVIEQAQKQNIEVMFGCMIESSLGIAAGALLGTQADYVDLDGNLLIKDDPFEGLSLGKAKQVVLSEKSGLGISVSSNRDGR